MRHWALQGVPYLTRASHRACERAGSRVRVHVRAREHACTYAWMCTNGVRVEMASVASVSVSVECVGAVRKCVIVRHPRWHQVTPTLPMAD